MKKFLNISLLLLMLCLSGITGCKSQPEFEEMGLIEPADSTQPVNWDAEEASISSALQQSVYSQPEERPSTVIGTDMISVSSSGTYQVTKIYPWPECGVVQLDKIMPKEVEQNKAFEYTIAVKNLTNTTLTDVMISEDIPGNFKFTNSSPIPDEEDQTKLFWTIDSLGPKAVRRITITGSATYGETLEHNTTILTPVIPARSEVAVVQPKLKLTKVMPTDVLLCDLIPVKLTITNVGTGTVTDVKIVDALPTGLQTTDGKGEITFTIGALMSGQSREFSTELKATKVGKYVSKAIATSGAGLRAESMVTTTTVGLPVLAIKKTGPERQYLGRPVTYEITITNKSDVAAKSTVVEDTVPVGVTSVKATAGAKLSGSKLTWEFGTLDPGSSQTVRVSYTPNKAGVFLNDAIASAYCANTVTASVRTVVSGIPALLLEVVDVDDPVRVGSQATYVIRVTNQGSANATNIRISCLLEDYVQYISSAGATASMREGDIVKFLPLANLAPQSKAAWRVVVTGIRPGDTLFKVTMVSEELTRPVEKTEATHLYE